MKMMKKSLLASTVSAIIASATLSAPAQAEDSSFFEDAKVTGGLYIWDRQRDRKDAPDANKDNIIDNDDGGFKTNLDHTSVQMNLDFASGTVNGFGFDVGLYATADLNNEGGAPDHEMNFAPNDTPYKWDWSKKAENGVSYYKAQARYSSGPISIKGGYIQPSGPGVLGVNWSFMPGTYQGAEIKADIEGLSLAYFIANKYKAPWFKDVYNFEDQDGNKVSYVHSLGARYTFDNGLGIDLGYGQSKDFLNLYHAKFNFTAGGANLSYQYYAKTDNENDGSGKDVVEGTDYQHAVTLGYPMGSWNFRLEGTYSFSKKLGNFTYRPTVPSGSSNGAYGIWWDNRSDFNHHKEKAVFVGASYDFAAKGKPGFTAGASYAYGWGGEVEGKSDLKDFKESAYSLDAGYTFQSGELQGATIKAHFTIYDNKTNYTNWAPYSNAFQDEQDLKVIFTMPYTF